MRPAWTSKCLPAGSASSIAAGETVRVPYQDISFYDKGNTGVWVSWGVEGSEAGGSFDMALQP